MVKDRKASSLPGYVVAPAVCPWVVDKNARARWGGAVERWKNRA